MGCDDKKDGKKKATDTKETPGLSGNGKPSKGKKRKAEDSIVNMKGKGASETQDVMTGDMNAIEAEINSTLQMLDEEYFATIKTPSDAFEKKLALAIKLNSLGLEFGFLVKDQKSFEEAERTKLQLLEALYNAIEIIDEIVPLDAEQSQLARSRFEKIKRQMNELMSNGASKSGTEIMSKCKPALVEVYALYRFLIDPKHDSVQKEILSLIYQITSYLHERVPAYLDASSLVGAFEQVASVIIKLDRLSPNRKIALLNASALIVKKDLDRIAHKFGQVGKDSVLMNLAAFYDAFTEKLGDISKAAAPMASINQEMETMEDMYLINLFTAYLNFINIFEPASLEKQLDLIASVGEEDLKREFRSNAQASSQLLIKAKNLLLKNVEN